MKHKPSLSIATALACSVLLVGCSASGVGQNLLNQAVSSAVPTTPVTSATDASAGGAMGSTEAVTYKNTDRHYSFTIPAGWAKQSGDVNSDR